METSTQIESSREGRKCTREANKYLDDAWENVGALTSQHRQRRSPKWYTRYMDLMGEHVLGCGHKTGEKVSGELSLSLQGKESCRW